MITTNNSKHMEENFLYSSFLGGFLSIVDLVSLIAPFGIVGLIFLNQNSFSTSLVGLLLASLGLVLRQWTKRYITTAWALDEDCGEYVNHLVTTGPYSYIRHPWYVANFLSACGMALGTPPSLQLKLALVLGTALCIILRVIYQENWLLSNFPEYQNYSKSTKRFIPFLA